MINATGRFSRAPHIDLILLMHQHRLVADSLSYTGTLTVLSAQVLSLQFLLLGPLHATGNAAHLSISGDFKLTCVCDFAGATPWSGVWRALVKEWGEMGADKSSRRTHHDEDHRSNEHIQRPCLLKMYIREVSFSTNTFIAFTFLFLLNCYGLFVKSFSLHFLISVQSCMPDF